MNRAHAATGQVPPALPARSPMLLRLADERATGVLRRATGSLRLIDGRVVHAESEAAPDLGRLLVAAGRLPRSTWDETVVHCSDALAVPDHLIKDGCVGESELERYWLTALFDAAFFALGPGGGPAGFQHGSVTGKAAPRSVAAGRLLNESHRRRRLLDGLWPGRETDELPVERGPYEADPRLTGSRRALLALADGSRTPVEIAGELGRPAFHVLLEVRRLTIAGLVRSCRPPSHEPPGVERMSRSPTTRPRAPDGFVSPDTALLQRVRDALEVAL
ncbi:transcriptional regulator [Streptomyces sp. KLOTTS4A1]|uniref:transcriptional regulator n=1 Tax=Streptomyces sp. KLOTTS4A1 TaxID=3390996 RepID=UPI0039F54E41